MGGLLMMFQYFMAQDQWWPKCANLLNLVIKEMVYQE